MLARLAEGGGWGCNANDASVAVQYGIPLASVTISFQNWGPPAVSGGCCEPTI